MSEEDLPQRKKRKPGPRPKAEHYESFSITMSPADFRELQEQMRLTGRNRSDLLRRAWRGLPLTPRTQHSLAVVKFYRELVELVSSLRQLEQAAQVGPVAQHKAHFLLEQVERLMTTLNEGEMQ